MRVSLNPDVGAAVAWVLAYFAAIAPRCMAETSELHEAWPSAPAALDAALIHLQARRTGVRAVCTDGNWWLTTERG